jgi:hypothetical protein
MAIVEIEQDERQALELGSWVSKSILSFLTSNLINLYKSA